MAQTQLVILLTSVALVVIGLYSAIFIDNIIKKIIGISFIEEGANLFIAFRSGAHQYCNRCKYFGSYARFGYGAL